MEVDIGAETYTVYADTETADAYALGASHAGNFRAASVDDRARFLVTATRTLDRQQWQEGYDTFAERENVLDIINASIELAISLADGGTFQTSQNTAGGIQSLTAGSVSITYRRTAAGQTPTRFPQIVEELLRGYLGSGSSSSFVARGTGMDEETIFPVDVGFTGSI